MFQGIIIPNVCAANFVENFKSSTFPPVVRNLSVTTNFHSGESFPYLRISIANQRNFVQK
jgi:hypothetical protein